MKLIFKYLKSFIPLVIVVVLMTFLQVQMELILPDYMSSIVTNGIQYGGITETAPKAISEEEFEKLQLFVEDKDSLKDSYTLIKAGEKAIVGKQEVKFNSNTYVMTKEVEEDLSAPIVYLSVLNSSGDLSKEDLDFIKEDASHVEAIKEAIQKQTAGNEDSFSAIAKAQIQKEYQAVGMDIEVVQNNYIVGAGLKMLGFSLIGIIAQLVATLFSTRIATTVAARLRHDVFAKIESFTSAEFSRFPTSSLITRTTNDITQVQMVTQMMLRIVLMAPMMGLTSVFKVMRYPSMTWLLVVAIGVIVFLMVIILATTMPKFKIMQSLVDKMNGVMREFLDGMLVVRAFNAEEHEEKRFDEANGTYAKVSRFLNRVMAMLMPISGLIMNLLTVFIIWFAALQIDINAMSVGDMMAFIQYAMHVVMSFMMVAMIWVMIPRSLVSAGRIQEILDTQITIADTENAKEMPKENATLSFNSVSFKYPKAEENVLENISFDAKPGETVAIIGSTGSGKSTIVKLIPRLFDVTEGSITYGGIDIRDLKQKDLRERIGFASQKAILFTGTIDSNIRFGREVNEEMMDQAVNVSQSAAILKEKENGINETITQGGSNVSGGQKQRLSIARALAGDPDIYIFDDSFSALDYATDKQLRSDLNKVTKEKQATVIIVAQRISTIRNADKIIVLDEGKIAGIGTHDELMDSCTVYQDIARSQLSEEELKHAA